MDKQAYLKLLKAMRDQIDEMIADIEENDGVPKPPSDDELLMARTMWGEARGDGENGLRAVAHVIQNRVESSIFPRTVKGVVYQPWQFSVWNDNDPNNSKARDLEPGDDDVFDQALAIARKVLAGELTDITLGADHYHAKYVKPSWANPNRKTVEIGGHIFYRLYS